jgi:hypothetical protein
VFDRWATWCALLGLSTGCWRGDVAQTQIGSTEGRSAVTVRLARDGEFDDRPPVSPDDPFGGSRFLAACPVAGEFDSRLADPVAEFARAHLVARLDKFKRDASTPVHVRIIQPGRKEPPNYLGVEITVQPRGQIGELEVASWWGDGGHSFHYCTHVIHENTRTVVVIKELWSAISSLDPTQPRSLAMADERPDPACPPRKRFVGT